MLWSVNTISPDAKLASGRISVFFLRGAIWFIPSRIIATCTAIVYGRIIDSRIVFTADRAVLDRVGIEACSTYANVVIYDASKLVLCDFAYRARLHLVNTSYIIVYIIFHVKL